MVLNANMALPVDIVLTAGQSNMSGTPGAYQNPPSPTATPGLTWEYRSAGTNFLAIAEGASGFSTEATYRANNGSCIPSFVNTVVEASGRSIVVVRAAVGGTALLVSNNASQGHWDTGAGTRFTDSVTRLNDCIADVIALGHTIGKVFVIWSQGGRDAIGGNNLHLYEAANAALVQRWRTATGVSDLQVFMEELSSIQGGEGSLADEIALIRAAQNSACASTDGLHMAFNEGKDYVNRPGWMRTTLGDNIHYMQVGLNYMGYKMGLYVNDHYGFAAPVEPPDPAPESPGRKTSLIAHRLRLMVPLPPVPISHLAPGTYSWLCPINQTAIKLTGWGAGGGGRGGVSLGRGGMGGGSGERRVITTLSVTPGATYTIVIPAGGNGSTYNTNDGTNGADMTFTGPGGLIMTAKGGGKPPTASTVGPGGTGGTGGTGTNGVDGGASVNTSGSDGAAGGTAPGGGAGGAGGVTGDIVGKVGIAPGGGGGGGKGNIAGANGGNGAPGGCLIEAA